MRNYIQPGHAITVIAPYDVAAGDGLVVGGIFGAAIAPAAQGMPVGVMTEGVVEIKADASAVGGLGAEALWDPANRRITTTSAGVMLVGYLAAPKVAGKTTVAVRLGIFGSRSIVRYAFDSGGAPIGFVRPDGTVLLFSALGGGGGGGVPENALTLNGEPLTFNGEYITLTI
jgi:predicted RecA/RadA family phage recombinase